jgi:hypothetical protein
LSRCDKRSSMIKKQLLRTYDTGWKSRTNAKHISHGLRNFQYGLTTWGEQAKIEIQVMKKGSIRRTWVIVERRACRSSVSEPSKSSTVIRCTTLHLSTPHLHSHAYSPPPLSLSHIYFRKQTTRLDRLTSPCARALLSRTSFRSLTTRNGNAAGKSNA